MKSKQYNVKVLTHNGTQSEMVEDPETGKLLIVNWAWEAREWLKKNFDYKIVTAILLECIK